MKDKTIFKKALVAVPFLFLLFLSQTTQAYAWSWGVSYSSYHHHNHYPYGHREVVLPRGFVSLTIGDGRYYYSDGLFYRSGPRDYVVVPAPVGAVIYTLPGGCHKVIVDDMAYYSYNGIYYSRVPGGYQVVEAPPSVVVDTTTVASIPSNLSSGRDEDSLTVNIPNAKGGYTAVILKRSGNGFVGPQGEFYPEFPKVQQLKVMYGR